MPSLITVTAGRVPIPFSGFAGYGDLPTPDQTVAAAAALDRYRQAQQQAQDMCDQRSSSTLQSIFDWATGSTTTGSICDRAAQMQINIDEYSAKIMDPTTSADQIAEILGFIQKETDISDLISTYNASGAGTIIGSSINPANIIPSAFGLVPWWVWAVGAGVLAVALLGGRRRD